MDGKIQSAPCDGRGLCPALRGGVAMMIRSPMPRPLAWTLLALAGMGMLPVEAANWPMHRGNPQLQGVAESGSLGKPRLAWTFSAGKPIKAAAAIAHGHAFVGDDAGVVHAVNLSSG